MLVTRSSPDLAGVVLTVPSSWPALFTDSSSLPGVPSSWVLYCSSSPAWPTRSSPAKPVVGRRSCFISCAVIGPRYPRACADPAQALGYLGPITAQEMKQERLPTTGFAGEDLVGQAGMEEQYNTQLEGTPGNEELSVNSAGQELGTVK